MPKLIKASRIVPVYRPKRVPVVDPLEAVDKLLTERRSLRERILSVEPIPERQGPEPVPGPAQDVALGGPGPASEPLAGPEPGPVPPKPKSRMGGARPGSGPKPKPLSQLKYPPRRPTVKPRPEG